MSETLPTPDRAAVEAAREIAEYGTWPAAFYPTMEVVQENVAEIITRRYAPLVKAAKWLLSTDNLEGQIAATVALRSALAEVKGEKL